MLATEGRLRVSPTEGEAGREKCCDQWQSFVPSSTSVTCHVLRGRTGSWGGELRRTAIRPGFLIVRSDRASSYQNQRWAFWKVHCVCSTSCSACCCHSCGPISDGRGAGDLLPHWVPTISSFFFFYLHGFYFNFYWSLVALQCCVSVYCTAK